ncbi:aromatic acid exporter family protein [Ornithinibacillus contaminans]|uniref:aromatic acid exporter family protein n=1 Tax=Ornithinibacillus contaminans TaxID=694055 RepID=UPI00064DD894|nr:aromatic acid exporter family protein [Ornithinibacillus contaminans]
MKKFTIAGSRILKTAVAIFLTAFICEFLNWPPVFAVITAIVTIEPTVSESIRKGIIRFPASAIGSAFAVLSISLFGNSALTYTLAGTLTIVTCSKLRLHAGLLVATITAVAMVEVIHDNYFLAFLIRLGTTTIGLLVSTAVNMFMLPPNYTRNIEQGIETIRKKVGQSIECVFEEVLQYKKTGGSQSIRLLEELNQTIRKAEMFIQFQKEESKYHPLVDSKKQEFLLAQEKLHLLRLIHYHLENLINTTMDTIPWSSKDKEQVFLAAKQLQYTLQHHENFNLTTHEEQIEKIATRLWQDNEDITKGGHNHSTSFPPELIIMYELISIYSLVERFYTERDHVL